MAGGFDNGEEFIEGILEGMNSRDWELTSHDVYDPRLKYSGGGRDRLIFSADRAEGYSWMTADIDTEYKGFDCIIQRRGSGRKKAKTAFHKSFNSSGIYDYDRFQDELRLKYFQKFEETVEEAVQGLRRLEDSFYRLESGEDVGDVYEDLTGRVLSADERMVLDEKLG